MTDPTDIEGVVVTGQRSWPGGSFPLVFDPTDRPPEQNGSGGGHHAPHPCEDPLRSQDWNADAAAAEALRRIISTAAAQNDPTHNLSNREYGAMICQASDGTLSVSQIQWGDPIFDANGNWVQPGVQPTVNVNFNACGGGSLPLGMIHTHPSTGVSGGIPSSSDTAWVNAINSARGDNQGRIYIVSIGNSGSYRIEIYNSANVEHASSTGTAGPLVNPDGLPCPGVSIG